MSASGFVIRKVLVSAYNATQSLEWREAGAQQEDRTRLRLLVDTKKKAEWITSSKQQILVHVLPYQCARPCVW